MVDTEDGDDGGDLERKLQLLLDKVSALEAQVVRLSSAAAVPAPVSSPAPSTDMMGAITELIKVMQRQDARQQALLDHMSRPASAGTVAVTGPLSSSAPPAQRSPRGRSLSRSRS